jgi:hypothetical protein
MTLWLRRGGLVFPADADRADYLVIEHEKVIGRIYEQRYVPADGSGQSQPSMLIRLSG